MISFHNNCFPKGPISKYSHMGVKASVYESDAGNGDIAVYHSLQSFMQS